NQQDEVQKILRSCSWNNDCRC
ncbi:major outer membrane protein, partial [Chlamydia suis MD56]